MSGNELKYIEKVFESNYIAPLGEYVNKFEDSIKNYNEIRKCTCCYFRNSSYSSSFESFGNKRGDDVLVSTFTFIGSINAILYQRCKSYFYR